MKRVLPLWSNTVGLACWLALAWQSTASAQAERSLTDARLRMVDDEIAPFGVQDPRVLQSMRDTPRHEFMPPGERRNAYFDMAVPIGEGQTISPPFVVAYMTEQIGPQPTDKVLEIGTGSGYQAAVLSPLVQEVYTIEIVAPLAERASRALKRLKYDNVFTKAGDGYQGWPEHAPFDKIIVTCSPEKVPQALVDQLKENGRMIIPLGERYQQTLYLFRKSGGKLVSEALLPTLFVPMTGAAEQSRQVKPDAANPTVHNGSFEEVVGEGDKASVAGWHYQRQVRLVEDAAAPDGRHYVTLENTDPGRGSLALQGQAIDGRQIYEIEVSVAVKGSNLKPGPAEGQVPALVLSLYDERRGPISHQGLGPWQGSFDWHIERKRIPIPPQAREVILRMALNGATGSLSFDKLELMVTQRRRTAAK